MNEHSHSSADHGAYAPTRPERDPMQAPWRISGWERGDINRVTVVDSNSNHVADVYDLDWDTCRAKGALVEFAPELLLALKVARGITGGGSRGANARRLRRDYSQGSRVTSSQRRPLTTPAAL